MARAHIRRDAIVLVVVAVVAVAAVVAAVLAAVLAVGCKPWDISVNLDLPTASQSARRTRAHQVWTQFRADWRSSMGDAARSKAAELRPSSQWSTPHECGSGRGVWANHEALRAWPGGGTSSPLTVLHVTLGARDSSRRSAAAVDRAGALQP